MATIPLGGALLLALTMLAGTARGDGTGMIGTGKTLYHPTCAFACRGVVSKCTLLCTPAPQDTAVNHGTAHNPVATPPGCFVSDRAFLQTVALCIDNYCPHDRSPPSRAVIEDYWAGHLGTGTMGTDRWVPALSYADALRIARGDEKTAEMAAVSVAAPVVGNGTLHGEHGGRVSTPGFLRRHGGMPMAAGDTGMSAPNVSSVLPVIKAKKPLNVTSFIIPADWQLQYNGMYDFEVNEIRHTFYTITIAVVAVALPILLSVIPRILPGSTTRGPYFWTALGAAIIHPPAWGTRHRQPVTLPAVAVGVALVPTRGQALYIGLISLLNVVLLLGPFVATHPQATFVSLEAQSLSIIGNRAGVMAMGNAVAMYTFAMRNNPLSYLTRDWSRGTYLLLHRWLGYWVILHTVLHSAMLLAYYKMFGAYEAEAVRAYWVWGIVGTAAACAVLPSSLLVVRQKMYEAFLASHVALSLLFLVGFYYHIWYCYEYRWGYEIWMFVASALWAADWVVRIIRVLRSGGLGGGKRGLLKTATVSVVEGTEGGYVHIRVDGVELRDGGFAYLYFPTLGWKFWEGHPFSVAYHSAATSRSVTDGGKDNSSARVVEVTEIREQIQGDTKSKIKAVEGGKTSLSSTSTSSSPPAAVTVRAAAEPGSTNFFARTQTGMTAQLGRRAAAAAASGLGSTLQLKVLVEATYHGGGARPGKVLAGCERLVCIAGGVGVTALLPYMDQHIRNGYDGGGGGGGSWGGKNNSHEKESDGSRHRSAKLYWGVRQAGLLDALAPELDRLREYGGRDIVQVETAVGTRLDVEQVLRRELLPPPPPVGQALPSQNCCKGKMAIPAAASAISDDSGGCGHGSDGGSRDGGVEPSPDGRQRRPVAVVVCGPPGMADEVRATVSRLARQETLVRPYVFIDEAFTW